MTKYKLLNQWLKDTTDMGITVSRGCQLKIIATQLKSGDNKADKKPKAVSLWREHAKEKKNLAEKQERLRIRQERLRIRKNKENIKKQLNKNPFWASLNVLGEVLNQDELILTEGDENKDLEAMGKLYLIKLLSLSNY